MDLQIDTIVAEALAEFNTTLCADINQLLQSAGIGQLLEPQNNLVTVVTGGVQYTLALPGYIVFLEYGVKGVEETPAGAEDSPFQYRHLGASADMIQSITQWAQKRGVTPKEKSQSTNRRVRLKDVMPDKQATLAFAIAKNVKKQGLPARHFMQQALTDDKIQALASTISNRIQQQARVYLLEV